MPFPPFSSEHLGTVTVGAAVVAALLTAGGSGERDRVSVKIEVNHVFRGTILPVAERPPSENTQNTFFTDI